MKYILFITTLFASSLSLYAQTTKEKSNTVVSVEKEETPSDSIQDKKVKDKDRSKDKTKKKDKLSKNEKTNKQETSIEEKVPTKNACQKENINETLTLDSLNGVIYTKNDSIYILKEKIISLEKRLVFADSIIARLSNECFKKKYDEKNVKDALVNFSNMYSTDLQKKLNPLRDLLEKYGRYNGEIVGILTEMENDKQIKNPFTGQKTALTYIDKLKATEYYTNIYKKNWTIIYLNELIDKAINRIKEYNPKENKEISFKDIY